MYIDIPYAFFPILNAISCHNTTKHKEMCLDVAQFELSCTLNNTDRGSGIFTVACLPFCDYTKKEVS